MKATEKLRSSLLYKMPIASSIAYIENVTCISILPPHVEGIGISWGWGINETKN